MNKIIKKFHDEYTFNFINYQFDYLKQEKRRNNNFVENIYKKGGWRFLRFRNDKETSNAFNTFTKVMQSIEENISINDLRNSIYDK